MSILLSDEELEALEGLPHLHRCLYIFGIRRYMDYQTGITGIKRKISYKSLSEEVYIEIRRGVKEDSTKSRDQVKRALIILEKNGLIERKSIVTKDEKQLILQCKLALTDESIQKKAAPWPPHSPALKAAPVENVKLTKNNYTVECGQVFESKSRLESRPTQNEKAAPHPLSVDLIRSDLRGQILNLLEQRQFSVTHLIHNKTRAMFDVLEEKKFTFEEIKEGIEHADAQLSARNERANNPWYYLDPILQKRKELEYAREKANRITEDSKDETNQPRATANATTAHTTRSRAGSGSERMAKWVKEQERLEALEEESEGN